MSTKIYDAFKFKGNSEEAFSFLKEVKSQYLQHVVKALSIMRESESTNVKVEKSHYPFLKESTSIKDLSNSDLIRVIKHYYNDTPWECILRFLISNPQSMIYFKDGNIYLQFFGTPTSLMDHIKSSSLLEDFHYQDSTDQSNYDWDEEDWGTMSEERKIFLEKDWEERRKIWDQILTPNNDKPSESGFLFEFKPNDVSMFLYENHIR